MWEKYNASEACEITGESTHGRETWGCRSLSVSVSAAYLRNVEKGAQECIARARFHKEFFKKQHDRNTFGAFGEPAGSTSKSNISRNRPTYKLNMSYL